MLDEDTARLLVSEALKDRLIIKDNSIDSVDDLLTVQNDCFTIDFCFFANDEKILFGGQIMDIEESSSTFIQFRSIIQDAHELLDLLKIQKFACSNYAISFLDKKTNFEGPFRVYLRRISNLDYAKNQCLVSVELIKSGQ